MKIAIKLNSNNVIISILYFQSEDYTDYKDYQIVEVNNIDEIIPFKTKYENNQFIFMEDYSQEYYVIQQNEELEIQLQQAIQEIEQWFNDYDMQVKQFNRDVRLGEVGSYHIGEEEYTIEELDQTAIQKAEQINNLRQQLNNL